MNSYQDPGFDKQLYLQRRQQGLRGQLNAVSVRRVVKDEHGNDQRVPLGDKTSSRLSVSKTSGRRAIRRDQWRAYVRQQRKASSRGV